VPAWLDGRLVMTADDPACDTRRLTVDGAPVTPPGLEISELVAVTGGAVLVAGSEEPTEVHLWRVGRGDPAERLTSEPGHHSAVAAGEVAVLTSATLDRDGTSTTVHRTGRPLVAIGSLAETPAVRPRPLLLRAGRRDLRTALLLPDGPFQAPLPVLLDPYGGPHHRQVLAVRDRFLVAQWFADQGFAVLVADGRGTRAGVPPGSGRSSATWPGPPSTTRWRRCTRWRRTTPSWTFTGSPSAAGRSAAIWPRWRCCGARTCSTPRSPAPR